MSGLGTIINILAIIIGSTIGMLLRKGIPERFKSTIMQAIGLAVVIIGVSGALQGIFTVTTQGKLDRIYCQACPGW